MAFRRRTIAWLVTVVVHALSSAAVVSAEPWKRVYVEALPDEAFAVVHVRGDGTRSRHLPHHDEDGRARPPAPPERPGSPRSGTLGESGRRRVGAAAPPCAPRGARHPSGNGPPGGRRDSRSTLTRRPRGFYNPGVSDERTLLTYRDYEELPADGRRYELHDGKLSVTPAPGTRHQRVIGAMHVLLRSHVDALRLGEVLLSPVDCILSDTTVVQPDLVYLDPTRAHLVSERGIEGPPNVGHRDPFAPDHGNRPKHEASCSTRITGSRTTGSSTPRPARSRPTASPRARYALLARASGTEPRVAPALPRSRACVPPRSGPDGPFRPSDRAGSRRRGAGRPVPSSGGSTFISRARRRRCRGRNAQESR